MTAILSLLVVDDELGLREMLEEYLTDQGCLVHTAHGGEAMREVLMKHSIDVVVLDLRMPGEDGLSLARFLREHYDVGIIMLTAAGDVVDRVVGLEMGADDYVTKPFDPRELFARVKSVARRMPATSSDLHAGQVRIGRCVLDVEARRLSTVDGETLQMTSMEFDLLQVFITHPNRVLSREQLLEFAHQRELEVFDRSIDVRITRLRRKVEINASKPQVIKTVRGAGYIFIPDAGM